MLLILVYSTGLVFACCLAPDDCSTAWGGMGQDAEKLAQPGKARGWLSWSDLALTSPSPPRVYCCLWSNGRLQQLAQGKLPRLKQNWNIRNSISVKEPWSFLGKDFCLHFRQEGGEKAFKKQYIFTMEVHANTHTNKPHLFLLTQTSANTQIQTCCWFGQKFPFWQQWILQEHSFPYSCLSVVPTLRQRFQRPLLGPEVPRLVPRVTVPLSDLERECLWPHPK